jgi:hypothetical protein
MQFERESPPYVEDLDEIKLHTPIHFLVGYHNGIPSSGPCVQIEALEAISKIDGVVYLRSNGFSLLIRKGRMFSFDDILLKVAEILERTFGESKS